MCDHTYEDTFPATSYLSVTLTTEVSGWKMCIYLSLELGLFSLLSQNGSDSRHHTCPVKSDKGGFADHSSQVFL